MEELCLSMYTHQGQVHLKENIEKCPSPVLQTTNVPGRNTVGFK